MLKSVLSPVRVAASFTNKEPNNKADRDNEPDECGESSVVVSTGGGNEQLLLPPPAVPVLAGHTEPAEVICICSCCLFERARAS